jgi:pseudouridine-5'-phosphate glycosidase
MIQPERLTIAPEVADALADGRPVVALESTLISHGLPYPQNLEVAAASELAVRASGAIPATVALNDGRLLVGLSGIDLETLAIAPRGSVVKVARPNLAAAAASGGWGATTVSATMIAARAAGIRVFATGGIGGVHRGALTGTRPTFDISADLEELSRTPVAVVCAGPKAILDVPLTLEYLETHGVPVVAIGTDELPGFYARGSGIRAPLSVPDVAAAARLLAAHDALGLESGVLLCTPVPEGDALPDDVTRAAVAQAVREADHTGIVGPELTPWLLARIASITDGASVAANIALIVNDARVAGELAVALATTPA